MVAEITKVYQQQVPATRFIGKQYGDEDRVHGGFGELWGEWFSRGWFDVIEGQLGSHGPLYEDSEAYIGLMRHKEGEPFQYWIGLFVPEDTLVPEGFAFRDFPASALGVCWVYGAEGEVYGHESVCAERLSEAGYQVAADEEGAYWFFERYGCPRFTTPDDKGCVVLDICHYVR